jgi:phosphoribosylformimino-5-aminoimidazole carboxamide ribotide isomerase
MKILPAIDIRQGRCVRLFQGDPDAETVYGDDPSEMARKWESQGAEWIHVVDLDAALENRESNRSAIHAILESVSIPVQVGGGVRSIEEFRRLIDAGVARVVFGTAAVEEPTLVMKALESDPDKVVVGVDVRRGRVSIRGWKNDSSENPLEFGKRWAGAGASSFVYTDIHRDGSLEGPNFEATGVFAEAVGGGVVASGGIGSLKDLERLFELESKGVEAAIVGKALYEGAFTLAEALEVVAC